MPKVAYDESNKTFTALDMERLKLVKDEVARISIFDKEPEMEFAHYIRTAVDKGSYVICLGEYEIIQREGRDDKHCPACAVASPDDGFVAMPRRAFVTHIIQYTTDKKGNLLNPASMQVKLWKFNDDKFNKLADRSKEHGGLIGKDLILRCTVEKYQNYDIEIGARCYWSADPNLKAAAQEMAKTKKVPDMSKILGKKLTFETLEAMVSRTQPGVVGDTDAVPENFADVFAVPADQPVSAATAADLDDILGTSESTVEQTTESPTPSPSSAPVAEETSEQTTESVEATKSESTVSFEDLIGA